LKALEGGHSALPFRQIVRIRQFVAIQYVALGDPKQAIAMSQLIVRDGNQPGQQGSMINPSRVLCSILVSLGDVAQAETYAKRVAALVQEARGSPLPGWRASYGMYGRSWESDVDSARAVIFEARGQYSEAIEAYRRSEAFRRAAVADIPRFEYKTPPEQILLAADNELLSIARIESKQGLLSQAEADAPTCAPGGAEKPGQVQSANTEVHHRTGGHPGRAGPLRGCRKAGAFGA
jgi:hypothetical protein